MRNSTNEAKRNSNNCNPDTKTNARGNEELFTGWRGTGRLIDNHYMAQAMSDEPIDLGMCEKVTSFVWPHLLAGQGKGE